jgi:hypothetical protein
MSDIDQLLDKAGSDVQNSVRERTTPTTATVHRQARRRTTVLASGSVLAVGLALAGVIFTLQQGGGVASTGEEGPISSEMILEDGVVTEEEYRAGAIAVVACLTEAGFEAEVTFDEPNPGTTSLPGHALFSTDHSDDAMEAATEAFNRCQDMHLSHNVGLGWSVALGQLDLTELRDETTAVTECVEQRTGQDFGELTFDQFGYLTDQGQQTKDAAFEYRDHELWQQCENDLGYLDDYKAETRATFECVEERAGKDFGDLTFDEAGHLDDESEQTLQAAMNHQDHQVWNDCRTDLGFQG